MLGTSLKVSITLIYTVSVFIIVLWVSKPKSPPVHTQVQKSTFNIELLFNHDGVNVYRFTDFGQRAYFSSPCKKEQDQQVLP